MKSYRNQNTQNKYKKSNEQQTNVADKNIPTKRFQKKSPNVKVLSTSVGEKEKPVRQEKNFRNNKKPKENPKNNSEGSNRSYNGRSNNNRPTRNKDNRRNRTDQNSSQKNQYEPDYNQNNKDRYIYRK